MEACLDGKPKENVHDILVTYSRIKNVYLLVSTVQITSQNDRFWLFKLLYESPETEIRITTMKILQHEKYKK